MRAKFWRFFRLAILAYLVGVPTVFLALWGGWPHALIYLMAMRLGVIMAATVKPPPSKVVYIKWNIKWNIKWR